MAINVFVGMGSNLGDSARILQQAWQLLGEHQEIRLKQLSSPFLSAPVNMDSNHWFTNAVGLLKTTMSAEHTLDFFLAVEKQLGRIRNADQPGYQDRTIDLDLLFFGNFRQKSPRLTLPHPRFSERLFVLAPIAEIAPDFHDPKSGKTMSELLALLQKKMKDEHVPEQEIRSGRWQDQP
ncbi:MAG: 2-amino-4-hydroxy-6-hydroxymethyldihydropteridine diphosphokinase [Desulfobacterales bacterium]|nr:MAG: 2-amino-4-hydroxy-6-hydroxymethyldihydropteridine diphosphokinase [Desulfobacterales bacterium]